MPKFDSLRFIADHAGMGLADAITEAYRQGQQDAQPEPCEDAVSREAISKWLKQYGQDVLHGKYKFSLMYIWKNLMDLPSAQPEQRWIPCEERLPEKEGWYITTVESEKTGKRRIENDLFAIDIALAHGNTPNKFCKDGYRQRTVAWMPFPEPYKEDPCNGCGYLGESCVGEGCGKLTERKEGEEE